MTSARSPHAEVEDVAAIASRVFWTSTALQCIASFLPPNDVACGIRLLNKFTASLFRRQEHITIHLSQPCPRHDFALCWSAPGATRHLSLKQRRHLISLAAASGVLPNLELALEAAGCTPTGDMIEAAAAAGRLDACRLLREHGCPWGDSLSSAARAGHQALCEWLLARGCRWRDRAVYEAARGGHVGLMDWLLQRSPGGVGRQLLRAGAVIASAAEGCDLAALQRLHAEWVEKIKEEQQPRRSLVRQQLLTLGDALGRPPPPPQRDTWWRCPVLAAAAASPTPDWAAKLEWLERAGYPRLTDGIGHGSTSAASAAASVPRGWALLRPAHLGRLQWLRARGYPLPCDSDALAELGRSGNTELLALLLAEGAVRATLDATAAAMGRDPHDAALLFIQMDDAVCAAAEAGHLGFLRALHAGGCLVPGEVSWLWGVTSRAARAGQLHVVAWLAEQLGLEEVVMFSEEAAASGSVELMTWLQARGAYALGSDFAEAVAGGASLQALEWMADNGYSLLGDPAGLYPAAAANGDLATLRWLAGRLAGAGLDSPRLVTLCLEAASPLPALRWLVEEAGAAVDWRGAAEVVGAGGSWAAKTEWVGREIERERVKAWVCVMVAAEQQQQQQQQ